MGVWLNSLIFLVLSPFLIFFCFVAVDIVVGDNSFVGADDVSGVFVMWIGILNKYICS